MAVYKRGDKGVFYMNFTVNGIRVFKTTGKFTKKEAKQAEVNQIQNLIDDAASLPPTSTAKVNSQGKFGSHYI